MALRDVEITEPVPAKKVKSLIRLLISEDGSIMTFWRVPTSRGVEERQVEVSEGMLNSIKESAEVQKFLDEIRDDTVNRAGE